MAFRALQWNKLSIGALAALSGVGAYQVTVTPGEMKAATKEKSEMGLKQTGEDKSKRDKALDGFKKLQESKSKSLLKKHLTQDVLDQCIDRQTKLGANLWDVISSGVENLDAGVGVYAPDAESYETFRPLMDPIIESYHGFTPKQKQPKFDMGEGKTKEFPALDSEGKYIKSTRIRCGRSMKGYSFNPKLKEKDYLEMEGKMKTAFGKFKKDLKGTYYPLDGMTKETQTKLVADHFLFKEGDRHLQAANACNYWPKGRGIFHNDDKTFLIWANEEDHMRIISMQNGSDVGAVLERLIRGVKEIESEIAFSRDERLGFLTFCPTNLGSTIRASVHIKLPLISAKKDWNEICEKLNLQVRGIHGEHSDSEGGVFDISNKARLGLSEYEAVKQMYDGVKKLIELEKIEEKKKGEKKGDKKGEKKGEKKGDKKGEKKEGEKKK